MHLATAAQAWSGLMSQEGAVRAEIEVALHCLFSSKSAGKNWESKTWVECNGKRVQQGDRQLNLC